MTIRQRSVYDGDHEAFRTSVARYLADQPAEFFAGAGEYGFVALAVPENLGGAGVDDSRFRAVVLEETMAAGQPALALSLAVQDSFALPLLLGTPDRLEALAPELVAGRLLVAVVDVGDAVRAEVTGDGWILTGSAESVINGQGADLLLVAASTGDDAEVFAVPPTAAGLTRESVDDLLGLDECDVADLRFDGVLVPAADRIDADLERARAGYQLALAVAAAAGARTALTTTVSYTRERKAFGTPIATFGNTRHVLGVLGARIAAVESFVDAGLQRATDLSAAEAAAIKLCATDILGEAVDTGVQLHGGYGYMWEYPIARAYAAARFFRLHGGAGEHIDGVLAEAVGL